MKELFFSNSKPLTIEALRFSVLSYVKINHLELGAKEFGVNLDRSKLKCLIPVDTNTTPDMEFRKVTNSNWVLYEHGKFVCVFSEEFLKVMKTTLKV